MQFSKIIWYIFVLLILPCLVFAQTPDDADAMARDALRRLEETLNRSSTGTGVVQSTAPVQVITGGTQPLWVNDPYTVYNRDLFFAVVRSASNREQAEVRALAALAAVFSQHIRSEFTITTLYTEAVNRGVVSVSDNTDIRDKITRASSIDNLVGAEINVWDTGRGMIHVVAYMDKIKTVSIYTDLIIINNRNIELLTTMRTDEKNTFDGYSRFKLAAQIAGINANYATIISLAGGSTTSLNLRTRDDLNLEAENIIRNITVTVNVINDRANRIQGVFTRSLNSAGLRTRGNNPVYTLEVLLDFNEISGSRHIWSHVYGTADLIENSTGVSLMKYDFQERDGGNTYADAERFVIGLLERKIIEEYPIVLREFLQNLAVR
jgi:hypothetical protein